MEQFLKRYYGSKEFKLEQAEGDTGKEHSEPETVQFWMDKSFCLHFAHHMTQPPRPCVGCQYKAQEIKKKWVPEEDTNERRAGDTVPATELRTDASVEVDAPLLPDGHGG